MKWECSECGAAVTAARKPVACAECGTAGVIFVETGYDDPEQMEELRAAWIEAGLRLAAGHFHPAPPGV